MFLCNQKWNESCCEIWRWCPEDKNKDKRIFCTTNRPSSYPVPKLRPGVTPFDAQLCDLYLSAFAELSQQKEPTSCLRFIIGANLVLVIDRNTVQHPFMSLYSTRWMSSKKFTFDKNFSSLCSVKLKIKRLQNNLLNKIQKNKYTMKLSFTTQGNPVLFNFF